MCKIAGHNQTRTVKEYRQFGSKRMEDMKNMSKSLIKRSRNRMQKSCEADGARDEKKDLQEKHEARKCSL